MRGFVIRLSALGAFIGGPLFVADRLKPVVGQQGAFLIAFAPIAVAAFAILWVLDERPSRFVRVLAAAGAVGCLGIIGMDGYALWQLWTGTPHPNATMIQFGCACGVIVTTLYFGKARPFFVREAPLSRRQLLQIAVEVVEGKRPQSDLTRHGLGLSEPVTGEAAKQMLLAELEATRDDPS